MEGKEEVGGIEERRTLIDDIMSLQGQCNKRKQWKRVKDWIGTADTEMHAIEGNGGLTYFDRLNQEL